MTDGIQLPVEPIGKVTTTWGKAKNTMVVAYPDHGKVEVNVRKAIPDDAQAVASVLNSVILEGQYTAFTNTFTEDDERVFIKGLCARSTMFVAEVDTQIVGIQVIEPGWLGTVYRFNATYSHNWDMDTGKFSWA